MIRDRESLRRYLEADRVALGHTDQRRPKVFRDEVWRYQILLRKTEYRVNVGYKSVFHKAVAKMYQLRLQRLGMRLGFSIPTNVFGPGLSIAHRGTIVVSRHARVGANCRIHVCVNIGTAAGTRGQSPTIGNNVYIGPGAKVFGPIEIVDGIAVGANAVVNKSFTEPGITIGGIPARKISSKSSEEYLSRTVVDEALMN